MDKFIAYLRRHLTKLPFVDTLVRLYLFARRPDIHFMDLIIAAGAVLYFVFPMDFLPDLIPGIGFVDDGAVIAAAVLLLKRKLAQIPDADVKDFLGKIAGAP